MWVLETSRLRLRRLTPDDLPLLVEMFADPQVTRFYGSIPPLKEFAGQWLQRQLGRYGRGEPGMLYAELKPNASFVGMTGVTIQDVEGRTEYEVGYHLRSLYWGQGLATEAALACRDYGFTRLGRERLVSLIHPENYASQRVAGRLGMTLERRALWHGMEHLVFAMMRPAVL